MSISPQNKIAASFRSWMTDYGLRRKYFQQETCLGCGEVIRKKYVLHPFSLPAPLPKGQWFSRDCACIKKERLEERSAREKILLKRAGEHSLPVGLRSHSFKNFKVTEFNQEAYELCRQFVRNFAKIGQGEGLLLYGRSGTGKTHLASAVANNLQGKYSVAFAYFPILLEQMRTSNVALDPLLNADLLILDDIGSERETGWTMERLLIIVDGRLTQQKPTLFTTNYALDDLNVRVGMRVTSRILGNNLQVLMQGPDWRLQRHHRRPQR